MSIDIVIRDNRLHYNFVNHFRGNADAVTLGDVGEKKTPSTQTQHLQVLGRGGITAGAVATALKPAGRVALTKLNALVPAAVAILCAAATPAALAVGIHGVSTVNNMTPFAYLYLGEVREFATASSFTSPVDNGSNSSFTHRMAWTLGSDVASTAAAGATTSYTYDLNFEVEDAQRLGYSLDVQSLLRGYLTLESNPNITNSQASAFMASVSAFVNTGTGYLAAPALDLSREYVSTDIHGDSVNRMVVSRGEMNLGRFVGTQRFGVRFSAINALSTSTDFSSAAALRFGLNTAFPDFLPASRYPGRDTEVPADHGHLLTVTATYNLAPVPEPATWATLGAGLAALLWRRRQMGPA